MQAAIQTRRQTRSAAQGTKSNCAPPDALDVLEQFGSTVMAKRAHEIYGRGESTEFCWCILSGCVRTVKLLQDGRRQIGEFLLPGDFFGMDDFDLHDLSAEAVTDVTLRRYPRSMVEALAQGNTALALRLRTMAVANLRHAYQQMALLGRNTATERFASFLLDMHRRSTRADHGTVDLPMGRADIADYLGLTIETVCRILARLRDDGTVAILRSGVELRDRSALLKFAGQS